MEKNLLAIALLPLVAAIVFAQPLGGDDETIDETHWEYCEEAMERYHEEMHEACEEIMHGYEEAEEEGGQLTVMMGPASLSDDRTERRGMCH